MLMAEISALRRRPLDPGTHTTRFFDMQRDHVLAASQRPLSLSLLLSLCVPNYLKEIV